jgi:hypothetical protein
LRAVIPFVSVTIGDLEEYLVFEYPYSTYALPAEVLDIFIVNDVDPIRITFVETDVAPNAFDSAGVVKIAARENLRADLRVSALLIKSLGKLIGVGIPPSWLCRLG